MAVIAFDSGLRLDELGDSVSVFTPVGSDSVHETVLTEPSALEALLTATQGADLEISCAAADCRNGLLPSRFTARFIGVNCGLGEFSNIEHGFTFIQPASATENHMTVPFGWLISIRLLVTKAT